jgi:superfamily I DNA and RNA helicase
MKLIPSVPEYQDDIAARNFWARLDAALAGADGIAYYKHPIILSSTNAAPDFTVLARGKEPLVVKIGSFPVQDLIAVQEETWMLSTGEIDSPLLELEDYLVGLRTRFDKQRPLRGRLDPQGLLVLPLVTRLDFERVVAEHFDLDGALNSTRILFRDDAVVPVIPASYDLSEDDWRLAQSVFQGVHPLNRSKTGIRLDPRKMGDAIRALDYQIALLDDEQHQVATQLAPGPQRIRGLAGTGKTVILAMKAANIHAHYPDARILFTFNTQSLYQQVEKLISQFYRVNGDISPDWEKIHVRHGWGSLRRPGVYADACRRIGMTPLTLMDAKRRSSDQPFAAACAELTTKALAQEYDYVLVDEAQDFPPEFFRLLTAITKEPRRIYFAYDEMQSLTNIEIPDPKELFGLRADGTPVVDIEGEPYPGEIDRDFVLHRSYRCPRDVLLLAHAVGLGIHAPTGCVQMLGSRESWEAVGYTVEQGDFTVGSHMRLSRSLENSPNKIAQVYEGPESFITLERYDSKELELRAVAERIHHEITTEGVRPENIVVISLDNRSAKKNFQYLQRVLFEKGVPSTIPGLVDEAWEFTQEGSVTLSTIYRAKGNEAPVVHLISFEALYNFAEEVESRNRAFTSISRAKGWLRVYGAGANMKLAEAELNRIVEELPRLCFEFPDLSVVGRKLDAAETTRRKRVVRSVKRGVADILDADEAALLDLDPEQLRALKERIERIR